MVYECSRKYREPSRIPDLHPAVAIKILIKPDKNSLFREGHIHGELKRMGRNPKLLKHVIELLEQTPEMLVFELADFDLNSLVFGSRRCLSRTSMVPSIIQHVLLGVGALHEQNFVHCDIKLENVLLVRDETSGKLLAKIADLGGASKDKEEFGSFHFDPRYLPPEMIMLSKEAFDYEVPKKAMDMWAVGVLLLFFSSVVSTDGGSEIWFKKTPTKGNNEQQWCEEYAFTKMLQNPTIENGNRVFRWPKVFDGDIWKEAKIRPTRVLLEHLCDQIAKKLDSRLFALLESLMKEAPTRRASYTKALELLEKSGVELHDTIDIPPEVAYHIRRRYVARKGRANRRVAWEPSRI